MKCVEERSKIIMQGGVLRECLSVLLGIAARHDQCEAHVLQVASGESTYHCASTHSNLCTANLTALSTPVKTKTLPIPSVAH